MAAIERVKDFLSQPELSQDAGIPEPTAVFIYRDGAGELVSREFSLTQLEEQRRELAVQKKNLEVQVKSIQRRKAETSPRGFRKKAQTTQIRQGLRKEEETVRSRLTHVGRQNERLDLKQQFVLRSDPADPLVVRLEKDKAPEIVSGKLLSKEDAEWLNFLRINNFGKLRHHPGLAQARMVFELRNEVVIRQSQIESSQAKERLAKLLATIEPPDELVPLYQRIGKHFEAKT